MATRTAELDAGDQGCPFQSTLDLLGRRHALGVLWALHEHSPRRFTEIKRVLDMNPVTLTQRLTELTAAGIVDRSEFDETPPRVEYELTEKGRALMPLMDALDSWAKHYSVNGDR